jgi:lipid A ethanolaminephosphotransferase
MPASQDKNTEAKTAPLLRGHHNAPWVVSAETLILVASLFWAVTANGTFIGKVLHGQPLSQPGTWAQGLALLGMLTGAHVVLLVALGVLAPGRGLKAVLALLLPVTASAAFYVKYWGAVLDPTMMRNVFHTNPAEAGELLSTGLVVHMLLYAGLPLLLLWRVQLRPAPWLRSVARRAGLALLAAALFMGCLVALFPNFAPLMRSHKEFRYLATPTNVLWSSGAVFAQTLRGAAKPRQAIGLDAAPGPALLARQQPGARPLVVVLVVGETARAANWGLSGYRRNTTPELASWPLINWRYATSCGTNTETSVPCMLAPVGRRHYDEDTIRGQESLLHVLARAGVTVQWRDNQSGCKGTCDGLPTDSVQALQLPGLCKGGFCADEGLLAGLDQRLEKAQGSQLLVLHMLGNHGPAYFKRYPEAFERFQPACRQEDLRLCSREEVVNAYDNALLYTDHVLARTLASLRAAKGVDTALLYASDHGESLGENNIYLHGLPYVMAPDVQKHVPMFLWLSEGLSHPGAAAGATALTGLLDSKCLQKIRQQAPEQTVAHDHIFHTLLGVLDVTTALYEPAWDLLRACRAP